MLNGANYDNSTTTTSMEQNKNTAMNLNQNQSQNQGVHPMSTNFGNITVNNTFNTYGVTTSQYAVPMLKLPANYTPFKISNVDRTSKMDGKEKGKENEDDPMDGGDHSHSLISKQILSVLPKLIHDD